MFIVDNRKRSPSAQIREQRLPEGRGLYRASCPKPPGKAVRHAGMSKTSVSEVQVQMNITLNAYSDQIAATVLKNVHCQAYNYESASSKFNQLL